MMLNFNRKNVAKIAAASSLCFLTPPSYQLNDDDVQDGSLVMENVRDGLKSNILGLNKIWKSTQNSVIQCKNAVGKAVKKAWDLSSDEAMISAFIKLRNLLSLFKPPANSIKNEVIIRRQNGGSRLVASLGCASPVDTKEEQKRLVEMGAKDKRLQGFAESGDKDTKEEQKRLANLVEMCVKEKRLEGFAESGDKDWLEFLACCKNREFLRNSITADVRKEVVRSAALFSEASQFEPILTGIDPNDETVSLYIRICLVMDVTFKISTILKNGEEIPKRFYDIMKVIANNLNENDSASVARSMQFCFSPETKTHKCVSEFEDIFTKKNV